jgi:hypothetical protein
MAAEIGPGSILVCVDWFRPEGTYDKDPEKSNLTVGAIYRCSEILDAGGLSRMQCPWDECGTRGVQLEGRSIFCYCPNLFKPLNDGDTSLVENEKEIEDEREAIKSRELVGT